MANKFTLDFKKFKHVKSDDKTTTLKHPDGHSITLSHDALSKSARSQLEALSKISKDTQTSTQAQEAQDQNPEKMAEGGKPEPIPKGNKDTSYLKGMTHPEEDAPKPTPTPKNPNVYKSPATGMEYDTQSYADGGDVASPTADAIAAAIAPSSTSIPGVPNQQGPDYLGDAETALGFNQPQAPQATSVSVNPLAAAVLADRGSISQAQQVAESADQPQAPATPPQEDAPPAGKGIAKGEDLTNPMGLMKQGYDLGMQGAASQAKASAQLGQDEQAAYTRNQEALKAANEDFQSNVKDNQQEYDNFIKDYQNQHIDPEQYWKGDPKTGEGGHSKIVTGISMLLSGFGGSKGADMFNDYLKYQMDNNIKAQEAELGKNKNLLEVNLRHFGNIRDATEMTRAMQAGMVAADLGKAMAQARGPLALANMQQAQSQLIQNYAPRLMAVSANQSLYKLANSQYQGGASDAVIGHALNNLDIYNPEAAKTWRAKYVPGVGFSSSGPVSDEVRNQIASHKAVNDLMNMSLEFSKQHAGTLSPELRAQAATIQQQLIGAIKQAQHDGVYKPSEAEFVLSQVGGDPASFLANFSSVPKIKQMQAIKQNDYNEYLRAHGLPTQQLNAAPTKTINGITYTKGPDGRPVRVKQ